jgi:hypothetical protein
VTPLSFSRLHERGQAILAWEVAGGSVDRLATLARRVTAARCTDWPGRPPGAEGRTTAPAAHAGQEGTNRWR